MQMVLSFKEWFDTKSDAAKEFILNRCKDWIDTSTPDYYKTQKTDLDIKDITSNDSEWFGRSCFAMYILSKNKKTKLSDYAEYYRNHEYRSVDFHSLRFLPVDMRKKIMSRIRYSEDKAIEFNEWLFCIEDYSKLGEYVQALDFDRDGANDTLMDILGKEAAIEYAKLHQKIMTLEMMPNNSRSIIFDTLFYGENGWSEDQKKSLMRDWARAIHWQCGRYDKEGKIKSMQKALYHVGMVRKEDLRYIYEIISSLPELGQQLYDLKKPASELTGNESSEMKYRYPMWLRKLFIIMACCARENISTANIQKLQKEGASLLKLYNFDFDKYFDAYLLQSPNF